jgi:EAL domain-containing protein (putative c-di-GMP-specific phosphodiesterase class I)
MIGVEALLRWNKPGFGLVPPVRFLPLASVLD